MMPYFLLAWIGFQSLCVIPLIAGNGDIVFHRGPALRFLGLCYLAWYAVAAFWIWHQPIWGAA